jgi:hypothetical protein
MRKHSWSEPPAGQSPMQVCSVCGERRMPPYDTEECTGSPDGVSNEVRTLSDYEPID